jgi:hypothetical protein
MLPPNASWNSKQCLVMPELCGKSLDKVPKSELKTTLVGKEPQIADLLAFSHWIGDEDRGTADVMLECDELMYVDNGLCGPAGSKKLRGAHPHQDMFNDEAIAKKCFPGKPSFVAAVLRDAQVTQASLASPHVIQRLCQTSPAIIASLLDLSGIRDARFEAVLSSRTITLRADYDSWLKSAISFCCQ